LRVLALDDSEPALKLLVAAISEALPSAEISAFTKPSELLEFARYNNCDIAFLDIKTWGMSGLAVAVELKKFNPKINIIFATAYREYATEAFGLHPSGYILKPVTVQAVEREIENLRHPVNREIKSKIYAQTFGNFEIFSYGVPLKFKYSKTKELIAYLIDRNGATINMSEICAVLWEDKRDSANLKAYLRKLISDLITTLKHIGADDIIIKRHNSIAIVPDNIVCDAYEFMKGDPGFVNAFSGQYMVQYSWAEMTAGSLERLAFNGC
jgi:two-component SAPR family response regulator